VRKGRLAARITTLSLSVFAACGRAETTHHVITRDSAGVAIVESRGSRWSADENWQVAAEPALRIGSAEGSPEYQLHRVEGAARPDDGRIVVADAGSGEIRIYDRTGRFLSSSGGLGDGPGEYRQITAMGVGPGDSLWVYDFGLRRFTVLRGDGEPVRTVSVGGALASVTAVGRLPDGSFVVKESWGSQLHGTVRHGLVRNPVAVARIVRDGRGSDTIATVAGREVFLSSENGRAVMSAPLFGRSSSAAIHDHLVFVGDQATLEVRVYRPTGDLRRVFRVPDADLRLTGADVARLKQQLLVAEREEDRAAMKAHLDEMAVPATRPAYGILLVDAQGNLWAGEYTRYPASPQRWTVFSRNGELLGEVTVAEQFKVLQIGADWVLGVGRDELDVEYVMLYGLEKPG
jgi:hypothetical protein